MASEIVENGLPSFPLLLDGMSRLTIEGYAYPDAISAGSKLDLRCTVAPAQRLFVPPNARTIVRPSWLLSALPAKATR